MERAVLRRVVPWAGWLVWLGACAPQSEATVVLMPADAGIEQVLAVESGVLEKYSSDAARDVVLGGEPTEGIEATDEILHAVSVSVQFSRSSKATGETQVELGWSVGRTEGVGAVDSEAVLLESLQPKGIEVFEVAVPASATQVWARVSEPGFTAIKCFAKLEADGDRLHIWLKAKSGATARGVVETASGEMPTRAKLGLSMNAGKSFGSRLQADGRLEVHFEGQGKAVLSVDGYEQGGGILEISTLDQARPPQGLTVVLMPGAVLAGVLTDGEGRPLPGTRLLVLDESMAAKYRGKPSEPRRRSMGVTALGRRGDICTTDGEGRFRVVGLCPEPVMVLARDDGSNTWRALHEGTLEVGTEDNRFAIEAARLGIRLRLPEGGYAAFCPTQIPKATAGDKGVGRLAKDIRVSLRPMEGMQAVHPLEPIYPVRWYATDDPIRWEVHLPPRTAYRLHAISSERPEVAMNLERSAGESIREVELGLRPSAELGHLELTIVDPPGTRGVDLYSVDGVGELGPALAQPRILRRSGKSADQSSVCTFELPPGRYEFRVRPKVYYRSCFVDYGPPKTIPGAGSKWIDIIPGGRQVSTLETRAVGTVGIRAWQVLGNWTVSIRGETSGKEVYRREPDESGASPSYWHEDLDTELAPGRYLVDAEFAGRTYTKSLVLEYGSYVSLEIGPQG